MHFRQAFIAPNLLCKRCLQILLGEGRGQAICDRFGATWLLCFTGGHGLSLRKVQGCQNLRVSFVSQKMGTCLWARVGGLVVTEGRATHAMSSLRRVVGEHRVLQAGEGRLGVSLRVPSCWSPGLSCFCTGCSRSQTWECAQGQHLLPGQRAGMSSAFKAVEGQGPGGSC